MSASSCVNKQLLSHHRSLSISKFKIFPPGQKKTQNFVFKHTTTIFACYITGSTDEKKKNAINNKVHSCLVNVWNGKEYSENSFFLRPLIFLCFSQYNDMVQTFRHTQWKQRQPKKTISFVCCCCFRGLNMIRAEKMAKVARENKFTEATDKNVHVIMF